MVLRGHGVKFVVRRAEVAYDPLAERLAVANTTMSEGAYFTHPNLVAKAIGFATKPKLTCMCLMLCLVASGCRQNSGISEVTAPKPSQSFAYVNYAAKRGKIVYNVKYQPQTVVFDEPATERAFRRVSRDASTYILDASEPAVRQLKPGSVLFLYGVALRKVTAVQTKGSYVVVSTTQADLTDAIRDGQIEWQVPIDITEGASQAIPRNKISTLSDVFSPPVWAAEKDPPGLHFEGRLLDFDFEMGFVPESIKRIKVDMDLKTTKLGGAVVELKGDGYVNNIASLGKILISNGVLDEFDYSNDAFNGKIEFVWTAQQQTAPIFIKAVKIHIPGASWEFPLVLGGLPFVLELSAAIIVHPALSSKGSFSTGEFTVSYDAKSGFKTTKAGTTGEGEGTTTQTISHDTSIFGIGPSGFVAALELPRVELSLGFMGPVPRVDPVGPNMDLVLGLAPASNFSMSVIYTKMNQAWAVALPIKPFAFINMVTSASTLTSGMTGTLPLPGAVLQVPCENVHLVVGANIGVGAKIGFPVPHSVKGALGVLGPLVPHELTAEPFEAAVNIFKKESVVYKNGKKCLGDP